MNQGTLIVTVLISTAWLACTDNPVVPDRGEAYFPLQVGKYLEYRVDSIIFDDAGNSNKLDTIHAFMRETIVAATVDNTGDSVYQIRRDHRKSESDPWQATGTVIMGRTYSAVCRVEDNQRLIKAEFPLYTGKRWDPVRYLDPGIEVPVGTEEIELFLYWDGRATAIDAPAVIHAMPYDSVLTCIQADEDTEIERRFVMEQYARHIGLVSRVDTIVDSRCKRLGDFTPCIGMSWMEKGEKGYIMQLTLVNHN